MMHINDNLICTSPYEYSLIREEATCHLWRLRCFQELPKGCSVVYGVGDIPQQYWGWQRWPMSEDRQMDAMRVVGRFLG